MIPSGVGFSTGNSSKTANLNVLLRDNTHREVDFGCEVGEAVEEVVGYATGAAVARWFAFTVYIGDLGDGGADFGEVHKGAGASKSGAVEDGNA